MSFYPLLHEVIEICTGFSFSINLVIIYQNDIHNLSVKRSYKSNKIYELQWELLSSNNIRLD